MQRIAFICGIAISIVSAGVSFMLGGLFGLLIWFCLFAFVALEVVYHSGANGSLFLARSGLISRVMYLTPESRQQHNRLVAGMTLTIEEEEETSCGAVTLTAPYLNKT